MMKLNWISIWTPDNTYCRKWEIKHNIIISISVCVCVFVVFMADMVW